MLTSLATNLAHRNKNVRLYEFGNIYIPKALPLTELPDERMQMTLGMYGECDFFTLKGVVEDMLDSLGLGGTSEYTPTTKHPFLHPGRAADVTIDGEKIARYEVKDLHRVRWMRALDRFRDGTRRLAVPRPYAGRHANISTKSNLRPQIRRSSQIPSNET